MRDGEYLRNYSYEECYWWFVGRRELVRRTVAALAKGLAAPRLLDVGCGTGYTLAGLARYARICGVDLSVEALGFSRTRQLADLLQARAEHLPFADESFDLLTALDVLEHLDDDLAALREWRRVCRPGGHVILYVPAHELLWSGEDYVSEHRRRYGRRQLRQRVEAAGFVVRRLSYANALLSPAIAGTILARRLFRPRSLYESNLAPLPAWLNRLLTVVSASEALWLTRRSLPLGTSLFCLAERPASSRLEATQR